MISDVLLLLLMMLMMIIKMMIRSPKLKIFAVLPPFEKMGYSHSRA